MTTQPAFSLPPALSRMRDIRFLRYLMASLGALAVDAGCFLALLATGASAVPASVAGYAMGILTHWLLSSRKVFHETVAARGLARTRQKALFVVSALVGLGLTAAIVGLGEALGLDPRLGKLAAIAVSFLATWVIRSRIVFQPTVRDDAARP